MLIQLVGMDQIFENSGIQCLLAMIVLAVFPNKIQKVHGGSQWIH